MTEPTKVFVSYSHDDADHAQRVLELAERLRGHGVDAWIDQYEEAPEQGWRQWMLRRIRWADYVLLVCTATYRRRAEGEEEPGRGLGAIYETTLLFDELYGAGMRSKRLIPVLFEGADADDIPAGSKQLQRYRLPGQYEELYRRLTGQPRIVPRPLAKALALPPEEIELGGADTADPRPRSTDEGEPLSPIARELETVIRQRSQLVAVGADTSAIDVRILAKKRELRSGPQLQAGDFLGGVRFQLIRKLGQGGFATVWQAVDHSSSDRVALKVLHGQFADGGDHLRRFRRGARQMARLDHPHIVRVIDEPGEEDDWTFYAMELCAGGDFQQAVLDGRLGMAERLGVIRCIAEALDHTHARGVVHRDVKPSNILLTGDGTPKLTDFDLVRAAGTTGMTRTQAGMGSQFYAAPEAMSRAAEAGPAADVYSLAATAVFAIGGQELDLRFLREQVEVLAELEVDEGLRGLLARALADDVEQRPAASEMGSGMLTRVEIQDVLGVPTQPPEAPSGDPDGVVRSSPVQRPGESAPRELSAIRISMLGPVVLLLFLLGLLVVFAPKRKQNPYREAIGSLQRLLREPPPNVDCKPIEWTDGFGITWVEVDYYSVAFDEEDRLRLEYEPFAIAKFETTHALYRSVMVGSIFRSHWDREGLATDALPVTDIDWSQADAFCKRVGGRLPTEGQWSFAANADAWGQWLFGQHRVQIGWYAWFLGNSESRPHPVGEKLANSWCLHDMYGNVREWTHSPTFPIDGSGEDTRTLLPPSGEVVVRGGSFADALWQLRTENRNGLDVRSRSENVGFRCVRDPRSLPPSSTGEPE